MKIGSSRESLAKFGLLGIIKLPSSTSAFESFDATDVFASGRDVVLTIWQGTAAQVVTAEHVADAECPEGTYHASLPSVSGMSGLLFGQFFGQQTLQKGLDETRTTILSRRVLEQYYRNGSKTLNDLNGAWVGIFSGPDAEQIIFARDPAGVETIYVAEQNEHVFFATDLKLLLAIGLEPELDEQGLVEFLHYLYVPSPRTVYRGIHSVLPGHVLSLRPTISQKRYARPRFIQGKPLADEQRFLELKTPLVDEFEEHLLNAVADSLPRQGRIALLLSGGKDSSSLAIALSQLAPERTIALTVGTQDITFDETKDATRVCESLGIPHQVYTPSQDILELGMVRMACRMDQPIGDPSSLPLFHALASLDDDVTAIFDGTGNDSYFGFIYPIGERFDRRRRLRRWLPGPAWPAFLRLLGLGPSRFRSQAMEWGKPIQETFVSWYGWTSDELEELTGHEILFSDTYLWRRFDELMTETWVTVETEVLAGVWEPHSDIRNTFAFARELGKVARFPFLDQRLVNFVNGLPEEFKFVDNTNKPILRAYMAKYLPAEILEKPKGAFVFDLNLLLRSDDFSVPRSLAQQDSLQIVPTWSPQIIARLLRDYEAGDGSLADRLYAICLLAMWNEGRLSMSRGS